MHQVQEAILKEPSRTIQGLEDIARGHSLEEYYCAHITSLHKVPTKDRIAIDRKNLLQPSLSGQQHAIVTKKPSGEIRCALVIKGSFLQIQMDAEVNNFATIPLTAASTPRISTVSIC